MPRDILLYFNIDQYSAVDFITEINEWTETDLTIRVNTNGGEPSYMWGMVAKFREFEGNKLVKVDGKAFSGGLFFLCYADDAEALDVAQGLVHRAAYPDWFESNPEYFTAELRTNLTNINKSLEAAFRAKVDIEAFENLKQMKDNGYTTKDIFSMDSRIDIFLSAKDMKKIGLVNRIVSMTPAVKSEIDTRLAVVSAKYTGKPEEEKKPIVEPVTKKVMTLEEIKISHPAVYAEIVALGIAQERDRVESIMVFNHIAPEICKEAVKSGKLLSETHKSEIALKQMSTPALAILEKEAPKATTTTEPTTALTADQKKAKEVLDFEAEVTAGLKDEVIK